jgi:dihydrodipicolinate synthase/N-acetylneuraminate lyase
MQSIDDYIPRPGLSIPIITVLDTEGRVLEDEQRAVVRHALQGGAGADIIFAAGTNGEWDKIDNAHRQLVMQIAVEECRRASEHLAKRVEAWAGITAHTRRETIENLEFAVELEADAAVVAPLSIRDSHHPTEFVERDIGSLFNRMGRMIPVFLYDNADIAAPGHASHMHTHDVKDMSKLPYVRGVKVTANKSVIGNYTRAASHFKSSHEFALFIGNAHQMFELFAPPDGVGDRVRYHWNRYLTQRARPYGIVAGPANLQPREWQRAWQVCRSADRELMRLYETALAESREACSFKQGRKMVTPTIACLKAGLVEMGVIKSEALAQGTPALSEDERREFASRFRQLREHVLATLERGWITEYDAPISAAVAPKTAPALKTA